MRNHLRGTRAAPFLLALSLAGCSGEPELAGSCLTAETSDGARMCIDYYDDLKLAQKRQVCGAVMRGTWSESACATGTALGGCRAGDHVVWLLPSTKHPDEAAARAACAEADRAFLAPGG